MKKPQGFAAIDADLQREISGEGGRAAHKKGTAHVFTPEEAREAGRKGRAARAANILARGPSPKRSRKRAQPRSRPQDRFEQQRTAAHRRGIAWDLTFEQWWDIWQASGQWASRGVKKGQYVMSRPGDVGPYAVGNVIIKTHADNVRESLALNPRQPAREKSLSTGTRA